MFVIIPTYNRSRLLPEAIESVLGQDYPFVKIVVVDDGSTDDTETACARLVKQHPDRLLYFRKENEGCASARNHGLSQLDKSCGYVCFLDSDDRLLPGKLVREVELLDTNPWADFTYSDSVICDEQRGEVKRQTAAASGDSERLAIEHFLTNELKSSAILYRSAILRRRRFREDLRYNEDSEFLQRVILECRGVYSSEPGCWIRWHLGSKSKDFVAVQKAVLRASLDILETYPEFYSSFAKLADQRIQSIRLSLFRQLMLLQQWDEAADYAQGPLQTALVRARMNGYYWLRRQLGSALIKFR